TFFPGTPKPSKPHTFAENVAPDVLTKSYGASLLGKFEFSGVGTLNTVSAYQHAKVTDILDIDQSPINVADIKNLTTKSHAFIQELNFASDKFSGFQFTGGGFFMDRTESFDPSLFDAYAATLPYPAAPPPIFHQVSYARNKKKSYAGYLELS